MNQETINRIAALIADDEHHDGAILMRRALVALFYRGPKWNFPLGEVWRLDQSNYELFAQIVHACRENQHHSLKDLAEQAKTYLLKHKA